MVRNGQWGETDHPFFLEKLWIKFVSDITCTGTVLPAMVCHTSSLPVQVILLCMYVCMYNLYFRLRNTEQHSHTVLGSIDSLSLCGTTQGFIIHYYHPP